MLKSLPPTVRSTSLREIKLLDMDSTCETAPMRGVVMAMKMARWAALSTDSFVCRRLRLDSRSDRGTELDSAARKIRLPESIVARSRTRGQREWIPDRNEDVTKEPKITGGTIEA